MEPATAIASSGVSTLERYAFVMDRTFPDVVMRAARGVTRRAMGITPPGNDPGRDGALTNADKQRGAQAIARDMNTLFAPVRLKNKRKERISGAEMVRLHADALRRKRPGAPMRRVGSQPLYVDVRKFNALEKKLHSHVGRLASGWMSAAAATKISVPSWVSRHGSSRGVVQMDLTGNELYFEAVNYAPGVPSWIRSETQRRLGYAMRYQASAMEREMRTVALKRAQESGLAFTAA